MHLSNIITALVAAASFGGPAHSTAVQGPDAMARPDQFVSDGMVVQSPLLKARGHHRDQWQQCRVECSRGSHKCFWLINVPSCRGPSPRRCEDRVRAVVSKACRGVSAFAWEAARAGPDQGKLSFSFWADKSCKPKRVARRLSKVARVRGLKCEKPH